MTVRFKCQSEYQRNYGVSRSRSLSPQRRSPLAGLRSDHMGISREPGLQHRRRLSPGAAQSCTSLLGSSNPEHDLANPIAQPHRTVPPAASHRRSVHRKEPSLDPKCSTLPEPELTPEPQTPAGPRPAADPGSQAVPQSAADQGPTVMSGPPAEKLAAKKSVKSRSSQPDSSPLTTAPDGQQRPAHRGEHALQWMSGSRGQTLGGHRSEYHRQFNWKKPVIASSPMLTAEQVLYSTSRSVPPFKKNPIPLETEYRWSFQGPATRPRLRAHLEHQRVPLFHTQMKHRMKKEESQKKPRPPQDVSQTDNTGSQLPLKASPPPPAQHRHRTLTEYESSFRYPLYRIPEEPGAMDGDAPQVNELRDKALSYRHRAWGTNFSSNHLNQLQSEHNALWEPTDTPDSVSDLPCPHLTTNLCQEVDSCSTSCVEALDLASSRSSTSSKRPSCVGSAEILHPKKSTSKSPQTKAQTPASPDDRRTAWAEEEGEEEEEDNTDDEDGRLPTPRLKMRPVQRTHHDLTTPATGGAIIVGALRSSDESSLHKQQRGGSAISKSAGMVMAADVPINQREAWSVNNHTQHKPSGSSPECKPASKPIRRKQKPLSWLARPSMVSSPLHGIQGTLRHPDFQHNGELGLRLWELQCSGGGCGSDEDDQLSVMSWRSAASCSMASAVLERAQKRRANFWGKR